MGIVCQGWRMLPKVGAQASKARANVHLGGGVLGAYFPRKICSQRGGGEGGGVAFQ